MVQARALTIFWSFLLLVWLTLVMIHVKVFIQTPRLVVQEFSSEIYFNNTHFQKEDLTTRRPDLFNNKKCEPSKYVIFLKTHKTGSSTIINILQRYAHNKNLNVVHPANSHFLGWPKLFSKAYIYRHRSKNKYNILCNHARFNKEQMLRLISSNETIIVTILRDPLYQFESAYTYVGFDSILKLNKSSNIFDSFFNESGEYIKRRIKKIDRMEKHLIKNSNAFDFGFDPWNEDKEVISKIIEKLEKDFHLIMIGDYMEESIVLLKRLLCWTTEDVAHFTMNRRPNSIRKPITEIAKNRNLVKNWNKIDYAIYTRFNKTFWNTINSLGPEFYREVSRLKQLNSHYKEVCLQSGQFYDKSQLAVKILGYKIKKNLDNKLLKKCSDLVRSEIDYTRLLKQISIHRQHSKLFS